MRAPTKQEREDLLEWTLKNHYVNATDQDREDEEEWLKNIWACVFDDYITDGPGYAGRVMVVVYGGDPSFTSTFIWQRHVLPGQENVPIREALYSEPKIEKVEIET